MKQKHINTALLIIIILLIWAAFSNEIITRVRDLTGTEQHLPSK